MYLQFSRNINNEFEEAIDFGVVALLIYVRSQIRISLYRHSDPFPPNEPGYTGLCAQGIFHRFQEKLGIKVAFN